MKLAAVIVSRKDSVRIHYKSRKKIKANCDAISVFSNKDILKVKKLLIKNVN